MSVSQKPRKRKGKPHVKPEDQGKAGDKFARKAFDHKLTKRGR